VLGENVFGLLSSENGRFFGRVLRELDEMGYNVGWCCYGAADVGAVHRRERVFIVANSDKIRLQRRLSAEKQQKTNEQSEGVHLHLLGYADEKYLSESAILRGNHGISHRVDRTKCLGNAVVPQQVYPILVEIAKKARGKCKGTNIAGFAGTLVSTAME
jgi:DNA (cytosine-5)-methyltransferase 1